MSAQQLEQTTRLQIAALVHRDGFAQAKRQTGLSQHQLMALAGNFRVHRATMVQAQTALGLQLAPVVGQPAALALSSLPNAA